MQQRIRQFLTTTGSALSTLALSLLPVFKSCPPCPLCMPKYAAILSFLGLPLADYSAYLMPIMWISMSCTIISMAWQGPRHYGDRWPAFIALSSALFIGLGREWPSQGITYLGMTLLLIAIVSHQWRLKKARLKKGCSGCGCDHKIETPLAQP